MGLLKSLIVTVVVVASVNLSFAETCTTIDAMTSPTKKFTTIASGSQYCATTATIKWQDSYSDGTRLIEWGTSTSYGNTITLSGKSGTATLSPLTPGTKYYWRVNRSYDGKTVTTPAGSFTTSTTETILPPTITSATSVTCTTGTTKTYTATATDPAGKTVTFTFSGQPSWITASSAILTMNPVSGSSNATVKIIASNGSAADTITLAVTVAVSPTSIRVIDYAKNEIIIGGVPIRLSSGNDKVSISLYSLDISLLYKKSFTSLESICNNKSAFDIKKSGTYICSIKSSSGEIRKLITMQK